MREVELLFSEVSLTHNHFSQGRLSSRCSDANISSLYDALQRKHGVEEEVQQVLQLAVLLVLDLPFEDDSNKTQNDSCSVRQSIAVYF